MQNVGLALLIKDDGNIVKLRQVSNDDRQPPMIFYVGIVLDAMIDFYRKYGLQTTEID